MPNYNPELTKRMTDVLDEVIATIPVDDSMSALVARIGNCIFKAAAEGQTNYLALFSVASAEIDTVFKERALIARASARTQQCLRE